MEKMNSKQFCSLDLEEANDRFRQSDPKELESSNMDEYLTSHQENFILESIPSLQNIFPDPLPTIQEIFQDTYIPTAQEIIDELNEELSSLDN